MSHRLSIRPEAEADMAEAFEWYEERQPALGYEYCEHNRYLFITPDTNQAQFASNNSLPTLECHYVFGR